MRDGLHRALSTAAPEVLNHLTFRLHMQHMLAPAITAVLTAATSGIRRHL